MSDRTPHLNRLLIFIIIILCLICGLLFTQSSAGPFGNSHTSVIAENTGDIAVLSSDKDQNIKLNISGTDISVSPSATPSPTPVKEQDAENVSPEAESGTWTADGTNWKFMVNGKAYTGWLTDTDGKQYYFDKAGIMQTGWVEKGVKDYYFNEDGSYDPSKKRPMIALTFDDGPGEYTETLLDTVEKYNIHVTFFMLGQNVEGRESTVQRMLQLGCEIGNHTWDHPEQTLPNMDLDSVVQEFQKTDDELVKACGQAATVCRAPYGAITEEQMAAVGKPFFMWSTDSLDWKLMDADADYNEIMNSDLSDGSIILMHDIHEPSVKCATEKLIPELVNEGYKLVTVSELAAAKDVTLQSASYSDFWDSSLQAGRVAGYAGNSSDSTDSSDSSDGSTTSDDSASADSTSADSTDVSDGSTDSTVSDGSDGSSDGSGDGSDGSTDGSSDGSDGSSDGNYDDGSYDDGSYDDGSYDDGSYDDGSEEY